MSVYDKKMTQVGQMKWRTCFSSISQSGYKLDILKSALQKYLRRRETDKMLWCLSEIYLFKKLASTDIERKACKGIISNMLNRLIIMMDEEMLFAEVGKYVKCMEWIEAFEKSDRNDFKLLVKICKTMIGARMLRLNSDIYSYWWKAKSVNANANVNAMECFIDAFENGSNECYYWAFVLFHSEEKGKSRFRRKDAVYEIWEYLFEKVKTDETLRVCLEMKLNQFFVKNRSERHIWLSSAISIVLHKENIDRKEWDIEVTDKDVAELFRDRKRLKIDDYAIDMHCSAGRQLGKEHADFALIGCMVVGEDKEYYNEEWRALYRDLKVNPSKYGIGKSKPKPKQKQDVPMLTCADMRFMDGSEIKEEEIRICMEKTCGNKVMCFEYNGKIWKESRKSFEYNKDYELVDKCKDMFGLKKIGMERLLSNFRIEKIDKKKSEWTNNWRKIMCDSVVYCCMRKVGDGMNISESKEKKKILMKRETAKEIAKIALFRGIFRVTDFNLRNILLDGDGSIVSIDEGDIGKRKTIFGGRDKWLKKYLTEDVMKEAYSEIIDNKDEKKMDIRVIMKEFKYNDEVICGVERNFDGLEQTLKDEGYM